MVSSRHGWFINCAGDLVIAANYVCSGSLQLNNYVCILYSVHMSKSSP